MESNVTIAPLSKAHNYQKFGCGVDRMDRYLRNHNAWKEHKAYVVRAFCATLDGSEDVIGFYTLTLKTYAPAHMSDSAKRKYDLYHAVPTVYLARIAVSKAFAGNGLGRRLMNDAMEKCCQVSELAGAYAMTLDAIDKPTAGFYTKLGFEKFVEGELQMFMPLDTIRQAKKANIKK